MRLYVVIPDIPRPASNVDDGAARERGSGAMEVTVDNPVTTPPTLPCCEPPASGAHPRAAQALGALPLPVGRAPAGGL